jgi:glycosyltransferase involved in cell wall biosynthesis
MKILFLTPYPLKVSPSQRFRFEQYFEILSKAGHSYQTQSFLDSKNWKLFYDPGSSLQKAVALIKGFIKRIYALIIADSFDFIFIHREVTPLGAPIFEWVIAKVLKKRIIYDFDDAIWLTDRKMESKLLLFLKWRSKVASICNWSFFVSGGNPYICAYASQFARNVKNNPTTIDTLWLHNPTLYKVKKNSEKITIGWTGSHSTLKYLKTIESELIQLEQIHPHLEFLIIADQKPDLALRNLRFLPWSIDTEIMNLMLMDIGLMPLPDDAWTKGKCGFKALQYMAMEIPTVVAPVGVNSLIVVHGENGYHCNTSQEWMQYLTLLINDKTLREQMGKKGRQKVIAQYSVTSNQENFLSLFQNKLKPMRA